MVLSNILAAIPPHYFLGYNIEEWTELIAIVSAFLSLVSWLFKRVIVDPLMEKISDLGDSIKQLSATQNEDSDMFMKTLEKHTEELEKSRLRWRGMMRN
jgi:hypothetical protein